MRSYLICLFLMIIVLARSEAEKLRVWREVRFKDGVAGSTSRLHGQKKGWADDAPEQAFDHSSDLAWWSGQNSTGGGGRLFPFPHLIWYDFQDRHIVPVEVRIRTSDKDYGPTRWQLIGSNDMECGEFSAWTILCEDLSGRNFSGSAQSKFCDVVDVTPKDSFRCLGIRVLDSPDWDKKNPYGAIANILDIRLWEKVAYTFV